VYRTFQLHIPEVPNFNFDPNIGYPERCLFLPQALGTNVETVTQIGLLLLPPAFTLISHSAYFLPGRWRHVLPKRRLPFNGLYSVISQKTELFI
jgi:hypothetical protein